MMKKYIYIIIGLMLTGLLEACQDEVEVFDTMTSEQEALIGKAVNFNVSMADLYTTRATDYTSNEDGSFNRNDRMRIFRNYWDKNTKQWATESAYRTYYFVHKYGAGSINLGTDWQPEVGRKGYDGKGGDPFTQTDKDSLTWENGTTLRFRAWSRSNYHRSLVGATKKSFYPDFCVSDWVTASGPTIGIPLVLKHLGCRIRFKVKESGNEFNNIQICANINPDGTARTDGWKDYQYADNADTQQHDNQETEARKTEETAKEECDAVTAVYQRMCMPAGVNMSDGTLMAVKNASWNNLTDEQVKALEEQDENIFIKYGTLPATATGQTDNIATTAKRPFFCNFNGTQYMISIPYDISNNVTKGELLTLPPCTRFRVYLHDTNDGDSYHTDNYEGKYHIFALSDVKKKDENNQEVQAFPNGMKLEPGVSYTFYVGYRYGGLYVVVNDDLSWTKQDLGDLNGTNEYVAKPSAVKKYEWWEKAIQDAIPDDASKSFDPVFEIDNERQFLEFIELVNGIAGNYDRNHPIYRLVKKYKETQVGGQTIVEPEEYGWSLRNSQYNPEWIEEEEASRLYGYVFYDHYFAANADRTAYSERDYLKGPYPFYDDNLRRNFKVVLKKDLDLSDWSLTSIGDKVANPFMGNFDGYSDGVVHTLKNVNMSSGYLFGYMDGKATNGASITNLKIESVHNTALLNVGVNPIYIAGISLNAPSSGNSIASSLSMDGVKGTSYVVGCIHVGDAGGPLVGTASDLNMFGCMQAAQGLGVGGALIGTDNNDPAVFKPQVSLLKLQNGTSSAKPSFSNFMCNFYDTTLSPRANAVGSTTDDYSLLEYIRGRTKDILCAKNDLLLEDVPMKTILARDYKVYYGLAPWKAMNYAIYWYNTNRGEKHPCNVHFESNTVGYNHRYPTMVSQDPVTKYTDTEVLKWNPISQPN